MKLLLTSSGLTNSGIADALQSLHGKAPNAAKIGFVPIAANVEAGNKDGLINQLVQLWRYGYNWIDIIDPTAAGVDWRTRLNDVDIIYLSGGNTFHLLDQVRRTGFDDWLKENLKHKVYIGNSASTILVTQSIAIAGVEPGDPNLPGITNLRGLGYVDYEISPHVPNYVSHAASQAYAATTEHPVYAIDDHTALQVNGKQTVVVGKGAWKLYC
jgi:dipeptidase E